MRLRRSASSARSSPNKIAVPADQAIFQLQLTRPLVAPIPKPELRACDSAPTPNCANLPVKVELDGGETSGAVVGVADATIIGITAAILLLLLRK